MKIISSKYIKIFLGILLVLLFILPSIYISALTPQEEKATLEKELKELEQEIARYETDISKTQQEKKSLQNQIYILKSKISKLDLQIQGSNIMIKDVGLQIEDTGSSIVVTGSNIEESREKLSNILRVIYEEDQKSLFEALLLEEDLSDFFENLAALETLSVESSQLLNNIKQLKVQLEDQKENLDSEKTDLENLLAIQILQKKESQQATTEKNTLLERTKGEEAVYQKQLQETKAKAATIRKRIFELAGVPQAPSFGQALDIAKYVEGITGVRPALLLAILTQESNIGKNVGQCYLSNPTTGAGVNIRTGAIMAKTMSPRRDVPHFLNITKALGRDPYKTPVSCPMSFGWGGAMGPAQFIPSTWVLYKDRVAAITGKTADPWNINDAFLASGLYLADYGAAQQTYNGEWRAAMIYFSGSTNTRYRFYGDSVMSLATKYQADIDTIERAK